MNGLLFLSTLRKVKNYPQAHFVDEKIKKLSDLEALNDSLQTDKRQTLKDLKELRRSLEELDGARKRLQNELDLQKCSNECERFEKEYIAATLELQALDLRDRLRKCEIELLALDQLNLKLKQEKQLVLEEQMRERQLVTQQSKIWRESERKHQIEIESLGKKFADASNNLENSRQEAMELRVEITKANDQLNRLSKELRQKEEEHSRIMMKMANSPTKTQQETQISSLRRQLESTRLTEEKLTDMLRKNEERADEHRRLMLNLERQLGDLRAENARLTALHQQQLAPSQPIILQGSTSLQDKASNSGGSSWVDITKQLSKFESDWKAERQQIHSILRQVQDTVAQKKQAQSTAEPESKRKQISPQEEDNVIGKRPKLSKKSISNEKNLAKEESSSLIYNADVDNTINDEDTVPTKKVDTVSTVGEFISKNKLSRQQQTKATISSFGKEATNGLTSLKSGSNLSSLSINVPDALPKPMVKKSAPTLKNKKEQIGGKSGVTFQPPSSILASLPKQPINNNVSAGGSNLIAPDSPSKYKPSTFNPNLTLTKKADDTKENTLLDNIFKDRRDVNRIKIPEKVQMTAATDEVGGGNLGGLRAKNIIDQDAFNTIVNNMNKQITK